MQRYRVLTTSDGRKAVEVRQRGERLLNHAMYNKSSAFTREERVVFDLEGLLPEAVSTMEMQAQRVYANICRKREPLERYIGMSALQDRNEHLFYRVLVDHLEDLLPIVYTPTVGQASIEYSHIFRRGRGIWITPAHRGRIASVLRNSTYRDIRLIVATDNSAILGLGDQGAGGMVIPIGKLAIYSAAAGIHPTQTLPISLDVGTEREELLGDDFYLGWRGHRLRGEAYRSLIEEFVQAVREVFPGCLIQWEDFSKANAFEILEHYRRRVLSFNDDIQGTGATALAGILAAGRISGEPFADHRMVVLGTGAAGKGIAVQFRAALEESGVPAAEARHRIACLDSRGLLTTDREGLDDYKRELAWEREWMERTGLSEGADLLSVVEAFEPSILIGTSGQPGAFGEEVVRAMAARPGRPIVFPFSNPTDRAEAQPEDLLRWTDGRALIATGSPFPAVERDGRRIEIGQGNNALVFPGIGLGALVASAREVTDGMFVSAAEALAGCVTDQELECGRVFPRISRLREVTRRVAEAVVVQAREAAVGRKIDDDDIEREVADAVWEPRYPELIPADPT
ncbi:MAG: NAD-dependent malic enzyme [Thermoanaerobaculia bacterium]|nr:NAD-dependent malic enzyme [Thermoanaerobaculia bacterium]